MPDYLVLYRGDKVETARMVAVSADPILVKRFASELLSIDTPKCTDPVIDALSQGRRRALRLIADTDDER